MVTQSLSKHFSAFFKVQFRSHAFPRQMVTAPRNVSAHLYNFQRAGKMQMQGIRPGLGTNEENFQKSCVINLDSKHMHIFNEVGPSFGIKGFRIRKTKGNYVHSCQLLGVGGEREIQVRNNYTTALQLSLMYVYLEVNKPLGSTLGVHRLKSYTYIPWSRPYYRMEITFK